MRTTIVNIGTIVSGDWRQPLTDGDSVSMIDGRIDSVGLVSERSIRDSDVVIDADGATVCPGLIDSQVHITFGDYTPRQKTVGYLESYLHGGTTTSISASEVHVPGRPSDPEGVKARANGDPVAVGAVITDGVPRFVGRSRNTPPTARRVCVSENRVPQSYDTPRD